MIYNNTLIYARNTSGKPLRWKAYTDYSLDESGYMTITIEFGQVDGKLQTKIRKVKSGKNTGKANETSLKEQTDLEIKYLYQKQFDKSYVIDLDKFVIPYRPQLAHKYKDRKHTIKWFAKELLEKLSDGYYASKKLNGIRCFIFLKNGKVTKFESRTGKPFKFFKHIADELLIPQEFDSILDGELFNKDIPFEILCSLINSDTYVEVLDPTTNKLWTTDDVEFHCYDYIDLNNLDQNYYHRFINKSLPTKESDVLLHIYKVENVIVHSEEEMIALAKEWIELGFEGLMLRLASAPYEFDKRSIYLLKFKIMEQEEFKIKNIYLAENDPSKVMFTLFNHHNDEALYNEFDCALVGDKDKNLEIFRNKEQHINISWLTVDYQVLSKYFVPLFPVGIIIRNGEVINGKFIPTS